MNEKLNNEITISYPRPYLGMSMVGESCHRYLQYYHYWAFQIETSSRMQRLFNFGHMMEPTMIEDALKIGILILADDREFVGPGGHWKGHADGQACYVADTSYRFLSEFKTHNDKSFKELKSKGLKESKPKHVEQMNCYMNYAGVEEAFYMAYNKNTSEYHVEFLRYDAELFDVQKRKMNEVIMSDTMLPRIGNGSPSWFECKFCNARNVCYGREKIKRNCRTCKNVDVISKGRWACGLDNYVLSEADQVKGCSKYELSEIFND